jgi:hypothetical protein
MAYNRTVAGLFIFQFLTAGLLSTKLGILRFYVVPLPAIFTGLLIPITILFYKYCNACFDKHDIVIPLEHLSTTLSPGAESVVDLSVFDAIPTQSSSPLRVVTNLDEESQMSTAKQEKAKMRVTQDYQCPSVSKPLLKVWIPEYISHLVSEEEEGDEEAMLQSIHSKHSVMESGKWTSMNELTSE